MILRRLGNKRKLAPLILPHFPPHDVYLEPFFGAGGMFFAKPKARHNFLNDADAEVYNVFRVLQDAPNELRRELETVPIHQKLFDEWAEGRGGGGGTT